MTEEKRQWCELGHHSVEDVQKAELDGRYFMICRECLSHFERTKAKPGDNPLYEYWQLYSRAPRPRKEDSRKKRLYILKTEDPKVALHLRAVGHKVLRVREGMEVPDVEDQV